MKVEVVSTALNDLKDISSYISNELGNPTVAKNIIGKIRRSFSLIADSPYIGQSLMNKINVNTPFRFLTCGNYLIFYAVEEKRVLIHRIIYGRRDYANILFKSDFKADNQSNED